MKNRYQHFILAPDSFKGTLSSEEISSIWEQVILERIPDASIRKIPMADGGEGMVNAYLNIVGGQYITIGVSGPLGHTVTAQYGITESGRAVIEIASCAGLTLVENHKDPLHTTTYGVGELILSAVDNGATEILLGLGGSSTNDCGIGMAEALGYRFFDSNGNSLPATASNMCKIEYIVPPAKLPAVRVLAACDVNNPLTGPSGAAYTFGKQKGADDEMIVFLDRGMRNIARVIEKYLGTDINNIPGAGAAGGLGAGVIAFLRGTLTSGISMLLDTVQFDDLLDDTDLVLTGEGRIDRQSLHGKVPIGISRRCKKKGVPCIAICGSIGEGADAVYSEGITAVFSSVSKAASIEEIRVTCAEDIRMLADSVIRLLCITKSS